VGLVGLREMDRNIFIKIIEWSRIFTGMCYTKRGFFQLS
jgi:hypothetical protein